MSNYNELADGDLYDEVLDQIAEDIRNSDFTAIEELLKFVPRANLIAYLPEEENQEIVLNGGIDSINE